MNLLPYPRSLKRQAGVFFLPSRAVLYLDPALPRETAMLPIAGRLQEAAAEAGVKLDLITGVPSHPRLAIAALRSDETPDSPGAYVLDVTARGVELRYWDEQGLRSAAATLRQLLREFGRRLPRLRIRDHPDFAKRGVMLDISRGRVPLLSTLLELVGHLADFKINEFQLYTEHTFAYRDYEPVWRKSGAITPGDILLLDARCRQLGIELVPNQNSFGHLRQFLAFPPLRQLAEIKTPWPDGGGAFLRYPSTLAPGHPGTMPFLRGLYDELLPCFTSNRFNVGCDETWDLGRGQSRARCEALGKGRVYLEFLRQIHSEVSARGKQMLFWGDIVLRYPDLVRELPPGAVALNWGYESDHPFDHEAGLFARAGVPFYVCPGTSTWMSLIGRHDVALTNLRRAAEAGLQHGASGYLNTDWGDGGHPQPLAVSYLPYLAGASLSWCARTFNEALLVPVASRDVFMDPTCRAARAAWGLGFAHLKFQFKAPNVTPFGAVIAAPPPKLRELFCRDGLKYYAQIPAANIRTALREVHSQRAGLSGSRPGSSGAKNLVAELDIAARMAEASCAYMLWQQTFASGREADARITARRNISVLRQLDRDFQNCWAARNQAKPEPFLRWRMDNYRRGVLPFPPEACQGSNDG